MSKNSNLMMKSMAYLKIAQFIRTLMKKIPSICSKSITLMHRRTLKTTLEPHMEVRIKKTPLIKKVNGFIRVPRSYKRRLFQNKIKKQMSSNNARDSNVLFHRWSNCWKIQRKQLLKDSS